MFKRQRTYFVTLALMASLLFTAAPAGSTELSGESEPTPTCTYVDTGNGYDITWELTPTATKHTVYRTIDGDKQRWRQAIATPRTTLTGDAYPKSGRGVTYSVTAKNRSVDIASATCTLVAAEPEPEPPAEPPTEPPIDPPVEPPTEPPVEPVIENNQRPYDVTATSNGVAQVEVTWADPLAEVPPTSIEVKRDGLTIAVVPPQTGHYADIDANASASYTIVAIYDDDTVAASSTVTISIGAIGECRAIKLDINLTAILWSNPPVDIALRVSEQTPTGYRFLDLMFENNGFAMAVDTARDWGISDPDYRISSTDASGVTSEQCVATDLDGSVRDDLATAGLPVLPDGRPGSNAVSGLLEPVNMPMPDGLPSANAEAVPSCGTAGDNTDPPTAEVPTTDGENADAANTSEDDRCGAQRIHSCWNQDGNLYLDESIDVAGETIDPGCYSYDSCYEDLGIAIDWLPEWSCDNDIVLDHTLLNGEVALVDGLMIVLGPARQTDQGFSLLTPLWTCDWPENATVNGQESSMAACLQTQAALGIGPSGIGLGVGGGDHPRLWPRAAVAVACDLGTTEASSPNWVTAWVLPDEDTELTPAAINNGLDCTTSDVIGGSLLRISRVVTIDGISDDIVWRTDANLTGTGETVLGHYSDGYIDLAQEIGASYFDIGDAWDSLTWAQRWNANKRILDTAIGIRDYIVLATPRTGIRKGSILASEITYLRSNGFIWLDERLMALG